MSKFFTCNYIFLHVRISSGRRKNNFNSLLVEFNAMLCEAGFNANELSAQGNELVVYTIPDEEYNDLVKRMNLTSYYTKDTSKNVVHEHLFEYFARNTYL